jgi:nucleotide-binding universal stress UspA family protein
VSGPLHGAVCAAVNDDRAQEIVAFAAAVAEGLGRPLILVSAYEYTPSNLSARPPATSVNEDRFAAAEEWLESLEVPAGTGLRVARRVVPSVDVVEALIDLAQTHEAVMLITGGDLTGHVTQRLLAESPCVLGVVPRGAVPRPLRRIGVAFDGSETAQAAQAAAMELAAAIDGSVELIGVAPLAERVAVPFARVGHGEDRAAELEQELEAVVRSDTSGVPLTSRVLRGGASHELVVASFDVDLIACGAHGRGAIGRLLLGSVSTALTRFGDCPVLIVPPGVRGPVLAPPAGEGQDAGPSPRAGG